MTPEFHNPSKGPINSGEIRVQKAQDDLRNHPIDRFVARGVLLVLFGLVKHRFHGLTEGAILGNPLGYPGEGKNRLSFQRTTGSRWIGYDFNRDQAPAKQRSVLRIKSQGRLSAFILDEIRDNDPDQPTPSSLLNVTRPEHALRHNFYEAGELAEQGLLKPTTHRAAYQQLDLYETYAQELDTLGLADDPVFQVTPKGNSLILVTPEKQEGKQRGLRVPRLGWLPDAEPI